MDPDSQPLTGGSNNIIPKLLINCGGAVNQQERLPVGKTRVNEGIEDMKAKALHHTVSSKGVVVHAVARWFYEIGKCRRLSWKPKSPPIHNCIARFIVSRLRSECRRGVMDVG